MKITQIFSKIWYKINRVHLNHFVQKCKPVSHFRIPVLHEQINSIQNVNHYSIFNEIIDLSHIDWQLHHDDTLFQYHLHYHDFLSDLNEEFGLRIIHDWIDKNPPSKSVSWDPYPISLRVINWIKFISRFNINNSKISNSLLLQGIWLFHQREFHLLTNHFFKNIVALLYLGFVFDNKEWSKWALRNLKIELEEQITDEGYHFEFSPSYHAIFVKDLLDVLNLISNNHTGEREIAIAQLKNKLSSALFWIQYFHDDGKFLSINDVNCQDIPNPVQLELIAGKLNIKPTQNLVSSFYPIIENINYKLMLYCAPFNPSYNPSHSHADILSVLLWYKNKPILVDTGNVSYEVSPERKYSRSTAAHNTIEINSTDQAELWKIFRIGDRAKILKKAIAESSISCKYHYRDVSHQRIVIKQDDELSIQDTLIGKGKHSFRMYYHISPECSVQTQNNEVLIDGSIKIMLPDTFEVGKTPFFPGIYQKKEKETIIISGTFIDTKVLETRIRLQ